MNWVCIGGDSLWFDSHQDSQGGQLLSSLLIALGVVIAVGLFISVAVVCVRWKMIRRSSYSASKEPPSIYVIW